MKYQPSKKETLKRANKLARKKLEADKRREARRGVIPNAVLLGLSEFDVEFNRKLKNPDQ